MADYVPVRHAYLRKDIENILVALSLGRRDPSYLAALAHVAVALGIELETVTVTIEQPRTVTGQMIGRSNAYHPQGGA